MSSKRCVIVGLFVLAALNVAAAGSASAALVEPPSVWHVGAGGAQTLKVGESRPISCKATTEQTPIELSTKLLGQKVRLKATGVACLPHVSGETDAKIEVIAGPKAITLGRTKFTGLSVVEPAGCKVPAEVTTEPLRVTLWEQREGSAGGKTLAVIDKAEPTNTERLWFNLPITGCALESNVRVTGNLCTLTEKANGENELTGEYVTPQRVKFDEAVQKTGECSLKVGQEPLTLMGTVDKELTSKEVFGANET